MESLKSILSRLLPANSIRRWFISGFYRNPIYFPISFIRNLVVTRKLTGKFLPLKVRLDPRQVLNVQCSKNSKIILNGILRVNSWGGSHAPSSISIGGGGVLRMLGDFEIGPGVHISISNGGALVFGGKRHSTGSGITCNSRIMVEKSVEIGADCIIAWDVFISDSNWHEIKGVERNAPVKIGDGVWIAHGVSVMKGAQVPSGCIVGAKSLVTGKGFPANSLLAGNPAAVRRTGVEWSR